jgi:uncharacterized protein YciI
LRHFAIICWDAANAAALRDTALAAHFAHVEAILDKITIAGPLKDAAGNFTGSLLIVTAEDETGARAILEADPYFTAGVWERFEIHDFLPAAGEWIGGKIW